MKILNIKNDSYIKYLYEYSKICKQTWSNNISDENLDVYVQNKVNKILTNDKVITIEAIIVNNEMAGFISLFKYDGDEKRSLTPWLATLFVKEKYRGKNYSNILISSLLNKASELGYKKVYLKSDLNGFYEKYNAKYIETLKNKEKLYYIEL